MENLDPARHDPFRCGRALVNPATLDEHVTIRIVRKVFVYEMEPWNLQKDAANPLYIWMLLSDRYKI